MRPMQPHDHSGHDDDHDHDHGQGHGHGGAPDVKRGEDRGQGGHDPETDHRHAHGHAHAHAHGHGHANGIATEGINTRMAIAVGLNLAFVFIEGGFGILSNSVALIADAGHNLSDVLGLLCAWAAMFLGRRPPGARFTYGLGRSSVLAALANAVLLLLACGAIAWEAVGRLGSPPAVAGVTVMAVAASGIVINGLSAWLLPAGSHGDLNRRGAYIHMLGDAAVSVGVLLSGAVILYTGWSRLDPIVSLLIVAAILVSTW